MQTTKAVEFPREFGGGTEVKILETLYPDIRARLAEHFATHFALVAATPDGEDSAGRAKLRLATVEEVVDRSCDLADTLWAEWKARGWLLDVPLPKPPEVVSLEERLTRARAPRLPTPPPVQAGDGD